MSVVMEGRSSTYRKGQLPVLALLTVEAADLRLGAGVRHALEERPVSTQGGGFRDRPDASMSMADRSTQMCASICRAQSPANGEPCRALFWAGDLWTSKNAFLWMDGLYSATEEMYHQCVTGICN